MSAETRNLKVKLGDFEFRRFEVPDAIHTGGTQILAVHQLIGGNRVVNAMGQSYANIEWSGTLTGPDAWNRMAALDAMRKSGKRYVLSFYGLRAPVVIEELRRTIHTVALIDYSISLLNVTGAKLPPQETTQDAVGKDVAETKALGKRVDDGILTDALDTLDGAVQKVSDFANAAQDTINSVMQPIGAVVGRVQELITTTTTNTVVNITTLGGILPTNPIARKVGGLVGGVTKYTHLPQLYQLQSTMGRMSTNVGGAATAGKTVTVAGGNLYRVAAKETGNAADWSALAKANGMTDPKIEGVKTLTLPKNPGATGGVLVK
ncbi:hypothetical protein SAMN02949497_3412 [Methylomagnum ishizawai]|uniref:LysM domain-containing protein n=1 Tax=Methylomagnum ishizawai TaxID=1760988 RepID=A0A1Y6D663_9GAMM|nr:hypothetical protein [Methylomagnum ishizawai]SMF96032.1 hypothetical protein SAMN02949497_3412 [Methylomagnum ishizawai]